MTQTAKVPFSGTTPAASCEYLTDELIAHQIELERLFNKNQLHSRIRKEFVECQEINFTAFMEEAGIPVPFGYDVLVELALRKRADVKTMVGLLRRHFDNGQQTADMLAKCVEIDLCDFDPNTRQFIVLFEIDEEVQAELDRFQYPLPMIVKPKPIRSNRDTGYLLTSGSVILKNNHTEEDVCLDHINRMNSIAFEVDRDVAAMVKNKWRNLDNQKPGETKGDFERRKRQFEKFDRTVKDVIKILTLVSDRHYLTHRYDKRGRTYCMGHHINYQGTPWSKAITILADKEIVL